MRRRQRQLVALVAVYAPRRAERLLTYVTGPGREELAREGVALAGRPRAERLAALARAVDAERGRADDLETLHPILRRLVREVRASAEGSAPRPAPRERTTVRGVIPGGRRWPET